MAGNHRRRSMRETARLLEPPPELIMSQHLGGSVQKQDMDAVSRLFRLKCKSESERKISNMMIDRFEQNNPLIGRFAAAVGETDMCEALIYSGDPRAEKLLQLAFSPEERDTPFTELCRRVRLRWTDLVDFFRKYKIDLAIAAHAPKVHDVLASTVDDSVNKEVKCPRCKGEGEIESRVGAGEMKICPLCAGDKVIIRSGSEKSRRLFLEAMGVVGKPGPLLQAQINVGTIPGLPSHQQTVQSVQDAIEIVPEPQEETPDAGEGNSLD